MHTQCAHPWGNFPKTQRRQQRASASYKAAFGFPLRVRTYTREMPQAVLKENAHMAAVGYAPGCQRAVRHSTRKTRRCGLRSSNRVQSQTAQHWLAATFGVSHSTISRLKPSIAAQGLLCNPMRATDSLGGLNKINKLAIVVFALSMSAVSADAAMMHYPMMHRHVAICAGGQVSASCMCGAKGIEMQACKTGQWCHPERAACTQ
jgi:hypothetical protein